VTGWSRFLNSRTLGKNGGFSIGKQIQKRLSRRFIEGLLEAFNDHRIRKEKTCEMIAPRRGQL